MPPNSRLKKHTKTFSGCWTCRARKVKCDEARPRCRQCRRKGTECEGYGVRLQWVNDNGDADPSYLIAPRSAISPDPHRHVIPYSQVNQILTRLDSLDQRRKTVPQNGVSLYLDCFGVFATGIGNSPTSSQEEAGQPISDSPLVMPEIASSVDSSPLFNFAEDALAISSWQSPNPDILGDGQSFPFELPPIGLLDHVDSNPWSLSDTILSEFGAMDNDDLQLQNYQHSSTVTSFSLLPTPTHLSNNERFLMYHYSQRVIYIFCVVDHEKSPWKTIHLPKALQATGELSIQGSTSIIRRALTNTLLGISAYLLCNETRSQLRTDEALTWKSAADTYRGKAITLLRDAVEQDLYSKSPPKYKDFLATTLSMITMNVISGDTATCGIHLDGAYRLITQAQKWKRKYSHKAQALHRIYFYLRTIYESTVPLHIRANRRGSSAAKPTTKTPCQEPDVYCRSLLRDQMRGYESGLSLELDARITNCERIYGIPHSLLFLLAQVIDLIDKIHHARDPDSRTFVPDELIEECDSLEKDIMDWPINAGLEESAQAIELTESKIIHHHTLAFHNALVIYFAQHMRVVGHRFLQPYVTAVLDSMEVIEALKIGTQILAAPLYWPAFIAGSEAFDKGLQARFRSWYGHVQIYRIEALRTGISVLEDVWKAGPSARNRTTSYWRAVVDKSDVQLMLS